MGVSTMEKRIAFFITNLNYGGAQTMLLNLLREINRDVYKPFVFVRESKCFSSIESEIEDLEIEVRYLNIDDEHSKGLKKIVSFINVNKEINRIKPGIVHAHLDTFYSFLYCILNNKNMIYTIHSQVPRIAGKTMRILVHVLERMKKIKIIGCAECISEQAKRILCKEPGNVNTIYNPIDLSLYTKTEKKNKDRFVYIHVGRLVPIKNQKMLINAFARVAIDKDNVFLYIIGDGPQKEELIELAGQTGVSDRIIFWGRRSDVAELLHDGDVFVLSSNSEACPMTILEAMAEGLPCISTDVGGVKELIGDAGILVEKSNENELVDAMNSVAVDSRYCEQMSKGAVNRVKVFDSSFIIHLYEKQYDGLYT